MNAFRDHLGATLADIGAGLGSLLPRLVAILLVLVVGLTLARVARGLTLGLLDRLRFRALAERTGVEAFLEAGGVRTGLSGLVAWTVYWLVIVAIGTGLAAAAGLTLVSDLLAAVAFYLPRVLAAVLIVVFGTLLARALNRLLFGRLKRAGVAWALTVSTAAEYVVQLLAVALALGQLGVDLGMLVTGVKIAAGALALALVIAFGAAGADWLRARLKAPR